MKVLLIIGAYLSAGMAFTLFLMWIEAKHPELNLGGWDDGAVFLASVVCWPLFAVLMVITFLCGILGKFGQAISERMKEDAKK